MVIMSNRKFNALMKRIKNIETDLGMPDTDAPRGYQSSYSRLVRMSNRTADRVESTENLLAAVMRHLRICVEYPSNEIKVVREPKIKE